MSINDVNPWCFCSKESMWRHQENIDQSIENFLRFSLITSSSFIFGIINRDMSMMFILPKGYTWICHIVVFFLSLVLLMLQWTHIDQMNKCTSNKVGQLVDVQILLLDFFSSRHSITYVYILSFLIKHWGKKIKRRIRFDVAADEMRTSKRTIVCPSIRRYNCYYAHTMNDV